MTARPLLAALALAAAGCDLGYSVGTWPDAMVDARAPDADPAAPDGGADAARPAITVVMRNMAFVPKSITVARGTRVTWRNEDTMNHDVTQGDPGMAQPLFTSGNMFPGDSWSIDFDSAMNVTYHCSTHPNIMRDATVTVMP